MSLEDYTHTNKPTHAEAKETIHRILQQQARGKQDAISSKALADRVQVSSSTVRDLIPEIRRDMGVPIGSSNNGYYLIQTREELENQIQRQKRQAEASLQTAREIARAYNASRL